MRQIDLKGLARHSYCGYGFAPDEQLRPGAADRAAFHPSRILKKMSKLDDAIQRFNGSLDRLEAAINRQGQRLEAAQKLQGEIDTLQDDRSAMAEELDEIKSEARRLNELNERASETLSNAIEGIREVLAEA
ncbi:putative nucleic acid-binding Zn-ribbon protein [Parvibaculum sp. MBR-TMA-1.3b-4.2]